MPAFDPDRRALRQRLLTARLSWVTTPQAHAAQQALQARVLTVLAQLEPECLGIYWPMRGEFNPLDVAQIAQSQWACQLALPCVRRLPPSMDFKQWDGQAPAGKDDCGIPCSQGKACVPDVVLVPCVGFTPEGWRLGYGGGYFDRFMAAHPEVTAVGVAWDIGQLDTAMLAPQAHDQALMAVVTESNTLTG